MTDLSLAGDNLAAPMQPDPAPFPWTVMVWNLIIDDLPNGFITASVGHYPGLAEPPEKPWEAFVSVTHWGPDGLPGQPVRVSSWHESEAAAKAAVERTIEDSA